MLNWTNLQSLQQGFSTGGLKANNSHSSPWSTFKKCITQFLYYLTSWADWTFEGGYLFYRWINYTYVVFETCRSDYQIYFQIWKCKLVNFLALTLLAIEFRFNSHCSWLQKSDWEFIRAFITRKQGICPQEFILATFKLSTACIWELPIYNVPCYNMGYV